MTDLGGNTDPGLKAEIVKKCRWWHCLTAVSLVLLIVVLIPRGKSPEFAYLQEGSVAQSKIIAPFDFEVLKTDDELNSERNEAALTVLPVLSHADSVRMNNTRELMRFAGESHRILSKLSDDELTLALDTAAILTDEFKIKLSAGQDELFKMFLFRLGDDTWQSLLRLAELDRNELPGIYFRFFERSLVGMIVDIYAHGLVEGTKERLYHSSGQVVLQMKGEEMVVSIDRLYTLGEALSRIVTLLSERFNQDDTYPSGSVSAAYDILQPFVTPDTHFDEEETDRRRQLAIAKVPLAKGLVKKDELIIDSNIRVLEEHIDKLNSLAIKRAELQLDSGGFKAYLPIVGNILLVSMIVAMLGLFIALMREDIWRDWKYIVVIVIIIALMHLFQAFVPVKYDLSRYMFPIAVGAMLLALLIDQGVALAGIGVIALLAGLIRGHDYPTMMATVAIGSAAILAVRNVRTRADVMRAGIYLAAAYVPLVLAFHFVRFTSTGPLLNDLVVSAGNVILAPMLVIGLVWIFENLFKITTSLSLLELIDLNRPLLRELAIKAPGTYHHSIMVGSLAEAAANEIGANALLVRAGAYYHDIGKMANKEFYIENQETGSENIHDKLPPSRSAKVIVDHVARGLELADQYGLPEKIKAFISEHHGRTKLAFFYSKACEEQDAQVNEEKYRYPGPDPQTVETGILMLADVVEAAIRSLDHPTSKDLREMVDKLVQKRVTEGVLDNCPLTFHQLNLIRQAFLKVLTGIYHQRIEYPDQKKDDEKSEEDPVVTADIHK